MKKLINLRLFFDSKYCFYEVGNIREYLVRAV